MDRRQFLQNLTVLSSSTVLPDFARADNETVTGTPRRSYPPLESASSIEDITWDIKFGVLAVGGAGGNILTENVHNLPYINRTIAIDTDLQTLQQVKADQKILLNMNEDNPNPPVTVLSIANMRAIAAAVRGLDIVFILAGMGGVTGTSISPIVAEMLNNHDIDALGVIIMPFEFEGKQRQQIARSGVDALRHHINGVFPISNEVFAQAAEKSSSTEPLLKHASLAFAQFYKCITDTSAKPGIVGIDFTDVRQFMSLQGDSAFGYGAAKGSHSVEMAVQQAIDHPLLAQHQLKSASGVLIAFELRDSIQDIHEISRGLTSLKAKLLPDTVIWWSAVLNPDLSNDYRVTIMLNGIQTDTA